MSCTCVHTGANRRPAYSNCQKVWPCAPESVLRKARLLLSTLRRHCYAYPWKTDGGLFLACAKYHPATDGKASSRLIQSRIDAGAPAVSVAIDAMHASMIFGKVWQCILSPTCPIDWFACLRQRLALRKLATVEHRCGYASTLLGVSGPRASPLPKSSLRDSDGSVPGVASRV